ncbi:hypothetical protein [Flavobacterium sp.]|uniref:hypothetical protein n=1 Tax=Flavobacterium sp. TaxID=239 RepID=UPI0011F4C2EA|nr:hypothetical protein [Flavobacterium sp.]RZJ70704.1 MAG: hypothetical protein EOO49_12695 [Flavobacterium sp.]
MSTTCLDYELQVEKARETVKMLEEKLRNVRSQLDQKPEDAIFRRELKQLTLDMKITMNELEHAQGELHVCRTRINTLASA